jgi:hypothetical protein
MKRFFYLLVLIIGTGIKLKAQEKSMAIGARLGEPSGISVRKYIDDKALDLNIGTFGGLWGTDRKYRKGSYQTSGVQITLNYINHTQLFNKESAIAYYGYGPQINSRKYYPKDQLQAQGVSSLSLGGNAVGGVEFFLNNSPISIYAEIGLYAELLPSVLYGHINGGAGFRFNF